MSGARDRRLEEELDRWTGAGLISPSESKAISDFEEGRLAAPASVPASTGPRRIPAAAEAMGYLGGALVVIGMTLTATRYWPDFTVGTRLALTGVVAVALMGAGALIHEAADPALARFRWFIWLASSAVTGVFFGVLGVQELSLSAQSTTLLTATAIAVQSGLLWQLQERPFQQIVSLGSLLVAAGSLGAVLFHGDEALAMGVAVWIVGAAYVFAGLRRLTNAFEITELLGAIATLVGTLAISNAEYMRGAGMLLLLADALVLVALAEIPRILPSSTDSRILGVVGLVGLFESVPATLTYYSRDAGILTGSLAWLVGASVIYIGIRRLVLTPRLAEAAGGILVLVAGAITANQSEPFALACGTVTSILLLGLGTQPGRVLMSAFGSLGLLIYVTWSVNYFFPGQAQAPLVITVAGLLVLGVAVWMGRLRGRFVAELGRQQVPKASGEDAEVR